VRRRSATTGIEQERDPGLGLRNERLLMVALGVYVVLVIGLMFERGVGLTPDVLAVAFGLSAVVLGRGRLFLRDWIPFVALLLAYELMRGVADDTGIAVHIEDLALAERLLAFGALPTQVLQDALRPASGLDLIAIGATVVYMLHFALPLVTGYILWVARRPQYYDYVASLILLSMAGFVTYLLIPAAPPWFAANEGVLAGPDGAPVIEYLKPVAFEQLAEALGFDGRFIYSFAFGGVNPNLVAAFPSLHVAFPFLAFLALRRAFGRIGWLGLGYTLLVAFSVVYTGDHWVIDLIAGAAYAYVAYYVVVESPPWLRASVESRWRSGIDRLLRRPRRDAAS
jgi:membrane-associated phospholipid phosphatase